MKKDKLFKYITFLLVYISVLYFFKHPIDFFLNKFIVIPLFEEFEPGFPNEPLLFILSVVFIGWTLNNVRGNIFLIQTIVCVIFYAFQRLNSSWNFYASSYVKSIIIWDIPISALILVEIIQFTRKKIDIPTEININEGFTEDNPIVIDEDDAFNRKTTATEIARIISSTYNEKSFAIGILGKYGSGKTSFLKLIDNSFSRIESETIWFNPWRLESTLNIQKDFFDQLASKLAEIDPKIASLIYSYARKLSRIDTTIQSFISKITFLNSFYSYRTYEDDYDRINNMIKASGKKIIIVIDDLDRLYNDEIMEVLRLIRNTANFSSVFYLVAFDKAYIINAIKSINSKSSKTYLDKIFQLEIPLPKREDDDLIHILRNKLEKHISKADLEFFEKNLTPGNFKNKYDKSYNKIFRNSRHIVKFINGFQITYNLIKNEVDFESLFLLELLKFRFSFVYDLLYDKTDQFLYLKPSFGSHEQYYIISEFAKAETGKPSVSKLRKYLEEHEFEYDDLNLIESIFTALFPGGQYSIPQVKNSISYPLFYQIYFKYRLSSYDLSNQDFVYALKSGPNALNAYIDDCISKNLHQSILTRLLQEKITDKESFRLIVSALFYLGPKYVRKTSIELFPYQAVIDLITDNKGSIIKKIYNGNEQFYKEFIVANFDYAPAPFLFHNELIYHIKYTKTEFIMPVIELVQYQVNYFNQLASSGWGLSENTMSLFWSIREEYTLPAEEKGRDGLATKRWTFS